MSLKYNGKLIPLAKNLRKNATPQENHLWYDFLSKYQPRFQRQKVIDSFIADFYCHKAKLIIEIDGASHFTPEGKKRDAFRTEVLKEYDLTVIRFTNRQIDDHFKEVCQYIDRIVRDSLTRSAGAPSEREPKGSANLDSSKADSLTRFAGAPSEREPKGER